MNRGRGRCVVPEQGDQPLLFQIFGDEKVGEQGEAETDAREEQDRLAVVGGDAPTHRYRDRCGVAAAEPPDGGHAGLAMHQALVAPEIARLRRTAAGREIGRRGHERTAGVGELAAPRARIDGNADAHRDVEPLLHQVDVAIAEEDLGLDRRTLASEACDNRCETHGSCYQSTNGYLPGPAWWAHRYRPYTYRFGAISA